MNSPTCFKRFHKLDFLLSISSCSVKHLLFLSWTPRVDWVYRTPVIHRNSRFRCSVCGTYDRTSQTDTLPIKCTRHRGEDYVNVCRLPLVSLPTPQRVHTIGNSYPFRTRTLVEHDWRNHGYGYSWLQMEDRDWHCIMISSYSQSHSCCGTQLNFNLQCQWPASISQHLFLKVTFSRSEIFISWLDEDINLVPNVSIRR